ncbi:MAG: hypothetical protein WBD99_03335 [Thermodesulfobacteriota bacterium]
MKKGIMYLMFLMFAFMFSISLSNSVMAQEGEMEGHEEMKKMDKMESVTGKVYCIEEDEQGNLVMKADVAMCKGSLVQIGKDGKAYVIKGTAEEAAMIMKQPGETKTVNGVLEGHTRGWVLASASAIQAQPAEETEVTGTIVCLLPNYQSLDFKQVVASGPCNELEPHLHVVKTKSGQVYALEGSEESIAKIEGMSGREEVKLQGQIQGEQGAWVLFVK